MANPRLVTTSTNDNVLPHYVTNMGGGGGSSTDVQINGTSITSNDVANIRTNSTYNASSNKIATMSDIPDVDSTLSTTSENAVQNKVITNNTGLASNLTTTAKTNIVAGVNELDEEIGDLTDLTTTDTSDLVSAINELDEELSDSGWVDYTDSEYQNFSYKKKNGFVYITIAGMPPLQAMNVNTSYDIATLPTGYRPTKSCYYWLEKNNGAMVRVWIGTGGNIQLQPKEAVATTDWIQGTISFPV